MHNLAFGADAVLAQVTVPAGTTGTATMGMQGRSADGAEDWQADNVLFNY